MAVPYSKDRAVLLPLKMVRSTLWHMQLPGRRPADGNPTGRAWYHQRIGHIIHSLKSLWASAILKQTFRWPLADWKTQWPLGH